MEGADPALASAITALAAAIDKMSTPQAAHTQQGQALQRTVVMGADETGALVPMPITEGGSQTTTTMSGTLTLASDNLVQKLAGVEVTATTNINIFTAAQDYTQVQVIITTSAGVSSSTAGVVLYHRPLGAAKADANIIFNGTVQAGMNIVISGLGITNTDVFTCDVSGGADRIVVAIYGVAR